MAEKVYNSNTVSTYSVFLYHLDMRHYATQRLNPSFRDESSIVTVLRSCARASNDCW